MKRSTGNIFQTVKTEGAILPAGLLQRIVDGDHAVPGLRAEESTQSPAGIPQSVG